MCTEKLQPVDKEVDKTGGDCGLRERESDLEQSRR